MIGSWGRHSQFLAALLPETTRCRLKTKIHCSSRFGVVQAGSLWHNPVVRMRSRHWYEYTTRVAMLPTSLPSWGENSTCRCGHTIGIDLVAPSTRTRGEDLRHEDSLPLKRFFSCTITQKHVSPSTHPSPCQSEETDQPSRARAR